ncbi:MAG: glycosyltransferase [Chloroflexi bacterium]|nr:glycosyltransferase [Chloroflexota bacterium]
MKLVAFPYHDWRKADAEGHRWRDIHLIDAFATHPDVERILVIDRPVSLAERLAGRGPDFVRGMEVARRTTRASIARITNVAERIDVLDIHVPDVLGPIVSRRAWWFRTFADARVIDHIRWAVAELGMDRPHAVAWLPTVAPALGALGPEAVLFDSLDNWMIHPGLRRHATLAAAGYSAILPSATAVVASAPASRDVLRQWALEVEVIPNGVDPAAFAEAPPRPSDLPPGPVVGYAGSLAVRIDVALVVEVARAMPDVSFVFIGQVLQSSAIEPMRHVPNIHLLGDKHYAFLPAYLAHFDVAWIPHVVGAGESGGDPIKMYEYWAAGREVVASRIDGLDRWADRLHLLDDGAHAVALIRGLLTDTVQAKRATVPPDRTWDAIAGRLLSLLASAP